MIDARKRIRNSLDCTHIQITQEGSSTLYAHIGSDVRESELLELVKTSNSFGYAVGDMSVPDSEYYARVEFVPLEWLYRDTNLTPDRETQCQFCGAPGSFIDYGDRHVCVCDRCRNLVDKIADRPDPGIREVAGDEN